MVFYLYFLLSSRGVLGKQGYQCQGRAVLLRNLQCYLKLSQVSCLSALSVYVCVSPAVCTCVVHKRCHELIITKCAGLKKQDDPVWELQVCNFVFFFFFFCYHCVLGLCQILQPTVDCVTPRSDRGATIQFFVLNNLSLFFEAIVKDN